MTYICQRRESLVPDTFSVLGGAAHDDNDMPAPSVVVRAETATNQHTPLPSGERGRGDGPAANNNPPNTHDSPLTTHDSLPPGDYVSPNLSVVMLDRAFPNMVVGDSRNCTWPYLRRTIPHNWYVDRRSPLCGFVSRDEAHILYHTAREFAGKRVLEVGCWMGWSAAHLGLAPIELDVIDPLLGDARLAASVRGSLSAAGVSRRVNLIAGGSSGMIDELALKTGGQWSLIFIDANHEGTAPVEDAMGCARHAAADAMILFHDLAAPAVADGFQWLRSQGWNTLIYETMQIMGVAWRGNVQPIAHTPDPRITEALPKHLDGYAVSGRCTANINQINQEEVRSGGH